MQNSIILSYGNILFEQIWSKKQYCQFKMKFGGKSPRECLPFLDQKYPFWPNLVQKIKIFSVNWNLVHRLIRICKIHFKFKLV